MNKVILIGRLTKDPDVRYTGNKDATEVARYALACERAYKRQGEANADFINCVAFGKNAEFAEKYLKKGTKIAVEGRWQTGNYKNRDGNTVYTNDCVVERQEFAESKSQNAEQIHQEIPKTDENGFMNIPDDIDEELPFN